MDEHAKILDDARAQVAQGQAVDAQALEARIRALGGPAEDRALEQLRRVVSVQRARARLAEPRARPAEPEAVRRPLQIRSRPTLSGTMAVRRERDGDAFRLSWDGAARVAGWEVRFSERTDVRGDYRIVEELTLPGEATTVELPLDEGTMRIHLLGRDRGGRLVQRAVISGLSRESWAERWQRRASAS